MTTTGVRFGRVGAVAWLLGMVALTATVPAQEGRRPAGKVTIGDIKLNYYYSPDIEVKNNSAIAAKRNFEWLQIMAEYTSEGARKAGNGKGWIEDMTVEWTVVVTPKTGKPVLMKRTVTYVDIEDGQHRADMFLKPAFIRLRYGANRIDWREIGVYLEIKVKDARTVRYEYNRGRMPKDWWTAEEPQVIVREGELLTRGETPFAPLDYDYYEHMLQAPAK